jgi:phosphatidate cytidylyltransferase
MIPIILWLIYKGPAWGLYALVAGAIAIGAHELFSMTHPEDLPSRLFGLVATVATSAVFFAYGADARVVVTLLFAVPLVGLLFTLARLGDIATAALRTFALAAGPVVLAIPLTSIALLKRDFGPGWVVMALLTAWMGDTGAYFAGRFLGNVKLFPDVSPKKTVEGAFGGLAASVLCGGVLARQWYLPEIPAVDAVVIAAVGGVLGQGGDLVESLIKRSTGVKDSGAIVPGHGGILDRVDALVFVSAVVYLYALWAGQPLGK